MSPLSAATIIEILLERGGADGFSEDEIEVLNLAAKIFREKSAELEEYFNESY